MKKIIAIATIATTLSIGTVFAQSAVEELAEYKAKKELEELKAAEAARARAEAEAETKRKAKEACDRNCESSFGVNCQYSYYNGYDTEQREAAKAKCGEHISVCKSRCR